LDERIKERLTGAAILVVIVVLLVPEMFRGERVAPPSTIKTEPGTPPLRSYTIELNGMSAAGTAPAASGEPPASVAPPVAAAPSVPPPAIAAAPAARSAPAAPVASADKAAAAWVVQVATFSKRENAARMVQQASKKGARLIVAGPDGRGMYRVRSAPQASRQAATALQARLKAQGYSGMISQAN
jgi:cell division septation protein DedD